ncbi:MAG: hypothetical protein KDA95_06810 [Acidimicrobiales bacterium]|nr:hypothetical protein [Acidimicrobiales bacterium]
MASEIRWRTDGHQLGKRSVLDVLRFEVADLNAVIKSCAASAEYYEDVVEAAGFDRETEILPLSCFAVIDDWTPARLAEGTHYSTYRLAEATVLLDAGFEIWPTAVYQDGVPDPRNEVHFDVVVTKGELCLRTLSTGSKNERKCARDKVRPAFEQLLRLLGEPRPI